MGQRLNIEIHKDENVIANAYYHWSGYSSTAIHLTNRIMEYMDKVDDENIVVRAVKLFEYTGARLTEKELAEITPLDPDYEYLPAHSRNEGLVSISKEGIRDTRQWEEARVTIDLGKQTIDYDVLFYDTKEDFIEYNSKEAFAELNDAKINFFDTLTFDKYEAFADYILELSQDGEYSVRVDNEDIAVVSIIE